MYSHFIHNHDKVGWDIIKLKTNLKLTQILKKKPNPPYLDYAKAKPVLLGAVPKILDLLSSLNSTLLSYLTETLNKR